MRVEKVRARRRVAPAVVLLLGLLPAAGAPAQLPPLPTGDKDFPKALAPVVEAEHAFAMYSVEHGMKEAFLRFAAPDGLVIRRTPVNAIEVWTQTNPAPTGLLTWYPTYADVSRAGDLGWTTGPWEFREKPTDKEAADNGHFVTLWRRQPDGAFKFVLDFGIRHGAPVARETGLRYPPSAHKASGAGRGVADVEAARSSLLGAERALADDSSRKGPAGALLARADETFRLYRQNSFPVVGREAARKALEGKADVVTWEPAKAEVSLSGDLGYAYGTYELKSKASDEKAAEQGNYMRIWKRQGGAWRVVMDVTNPVRPQ
jgi:ketosteroid isomerase-like protein